MTYVTESSELHDVLPMKCWPETEYRLDMCRATNGVHFEMY